jgi:sugar O-acyltransferase (sialic acid O-acetyltransferase NeuD family)
MRQKVVIIGAGGFGREVLDICEEDNRSGVRWEILGFVDDNPEVQSQKVRGYPVLGGVEVFSKFKANEVKAVIAIGDNRIRKKVAEKAAAYGAGFCNVIHPSAIMTPHVKLGKGVIIAAGCILTNNITVGDFVIINLGVTVGHDTEIESFVNLNPGVHINGNNKIGEGAYIGSGAVTIQNITIGKWSVIGAGAVVTNDIPDRVVAVGVPAKPIKLMENEEKATSRIVDSI